ncbi:hypothetical protein [Phenylobacterium sp.]|uniref:hypothetical protein n=1 Tax=Phenylobacterium sp. TaxID=1871053 RepID=UPI0025E19C7F|nr:hypothetical protein [Phenylobacterium sp.]MBX3482564.1 hypothetical protein [Phenylobacterium sp.]MCW5758772.1 hypothetical protein [Phenylobacterium sp.]
MTKTISFTTARGSRIDLSLVTEAPSLADHTVMIPAWEMRVVINGNWQTGGWWGLVDHETVGRCIKVGDTYIPVPADVLAEVEALIGEYVGVREARRVAAEKAEADYQREYSAVERLSRTGRAD